jgi:hypothetical protein
MEKSVSAKMKKYEPDGQCCAILKDKSRCKNQTAKNSNYWCDEHKEECISKRNETDL